MTENITKNIENNNNIAFNSIVSMTSSVSSRNSDKNFSNIMGNLNAKTQKIQTNFVDKAVKSNTSSINKKALQTNKNKSTESTNIKINKTNDKKNIKQEKNIKTINTENTVNNPNENKTSSENIKNNNELNVLSEKKADDYKNTDNQDNVSDKNIDSFVQTSPVFFENNEENLKDNSTVVSETKILDIIADSIGISLPDTQTTESKIDTLSNEILNTDSSLGDIQSIVETAFSENNLSKEDKEVLSEIFEKLNELIQKDSEGKNISFEKIKDTINGALNSKAEITNENNINLKAEHDTEAANNNKTFVFEDKNKDVDTLNTEINKDSSVAKNVKTNEYNIDLNKVQNNQIKLNSDNKEETKTDKNIEIASENNETTIADGYSVEIKEEEFKTNSNDNKISTTLENGAKKETEDGSIQAVNISEEKNILKENDKKIKQELFKEEDINSSTANKTADLSNQTKIKDDSIVVKAVQEENSENTDSNSKNINNDEIFSAKESENNDKIQILSENNKNMEFDYNVSINSSNTNNDSKNNEKIENNTEDTIELKPEETSNTAQKQDLSQNFTNNQGEKENYNQLNNKKEYDFTVNNTNKEISNDNLKVKTTDNKIKEDLKTTEENLEKIASTEELLDDMMISLEKTSSSAGALTVADEVTKLALEENGSINSSTISGHVVYDSIGQNLTIKNTAIGKMAESIFNQLQSKLEQSEIFNQITDKLVDLKNSAMQKLTMVLRPNDLGRLSIELLTNKDGLTTNILAQNNDVRAYIEKNIESLRKQLVEAGINVNNIQIKTAGEEGTTSYSGNGQSANENVNQEFSGQNKKNNEQNFKEQNNADKEILAKMSNYDYSFARDFSTVLNKTLNYGLS